MTFIIVLLQSNNEYQHPPETGTNTIVGFKTNQKEKADSTSSTRIFISASTLFIHILKMFNCLRFLS